MSLTVEGFIRDRWVHYGAPLGSFSSFAFAEFIGVRATDRRVNPGSLRSLGCPLVLIVLMQGRWVHWCVTWNVSGSCGVAVFIGVLPEGP